MRVGGQRRNRRECPIINMYRLGLEESLENILLDTKNSSINCNIRKT